MSKSSIFGHGSGGNSSLVFLRQEIIAAKVGREKVGSSAAKVGREKVESSVAKPLSHSTLLTNTSKLRLGKS